MRKGMDMNEHMNFISHVCVASVKHPPFISKTIKPVKDDIHFKINSLNANSETKTMAHEITQNNVKNDYL